MVSSAATTTRTENSLVGLRPLLLCVQRNRGRIFRLMPPNNSDCNNNKIRRKSVRRRTVTDRDQSAQEKKSRVGVTPVSRTTMASGDDESNQLKERSQPVNRSGREDFGAGYGGGRKA
ncbi:unnamed protein product [Linum trigynum]|uniref:Uncharacterized protein n=1 Tax=Linum trigynum TaxID=586398 RepID=A0AAV2D7Z7_9ROSI